MLMGPFLSLIWLHVVCGFSGCGMLVVTQHPKEIKESYGGSANMTCHWNMSNAGRIRVEWRKYHFIHIGKENGTLLGASLWPYHNNAIRTCNVSNCSYRTSMDAAWIQLDSVTEEDNGLYVCHVSNEIPTLSQGTGNGTWLQVPKGDKAVSAKLKLLGLICILPAILIAGCFICCRRKSPKRKIVQQKAEQESPKLMEHLAQDNMDANENSSSSNSMIWAASTVYESFDYFAMKNKDEEPAASSDQHNGGADGHPACSDEPNPYCNEPSANCNESATSLDKLASMPDNNIDDSETSP